MDGRNDDIVQNSFSDEQVAKLREATGEGADLKHILACNYRTVLAAKGVCVFAAVVFDDESWSPRVTHPRSVVAGDHE